MTNQPATQAEMQQILSRHEESIKANPWPLPGAVMQYTLSLWEFQQLLGYIRSLEAEHRAMRKAMSEHETQCSRKGLYPVLSSLTLRP